MCLSDLIDCCEFGINYFRIFDSNKNLICELTPSKTEALTEGIINPNVKVSKYNVQFIMLNNSSAHVMFIYL